mmetsp:Transcript_27940/g.54321  ORF Transcript_27940/g.54321 Transcript_27940/m.54321 type:complete len:112 (+) Transcript_27940:224-559(+)
MIMISFCFLHRVHYVCWKYDDVSFTGLERPLLVVFVHVGRMKGQASRIFWYLWIVNPRQRMFMMRVCTMSAPFRMNGCPNTSDLQFGFTGARRNGATQWMQQSHISKDFNE